MTVIVLGGFLGSGKTTFLLQLAPFLAKFSEKDPGVVVLENEISVTDVDTKMLRSHNLTVRNLAAGCICCTSSADLPISVRKIHEEYDSDYLIIEATGMAYPDSIAQIVEQETGLPVKVAALADASRWEKLNFAMPQFVRGQLNRADVVFVNKCDLVSSEKTTEIRNAISSQTNVPVFCVSLSERLTDGQLELLR